MASMPEEPITLTCGCQVKTSRDFLGRVVGTIVSAIRSVCAGRSCARACRPDAGSGERRRLTRGRSPYRIEAKRLTQEDEEHILGHVFGRLSRADHAPHEAVDRILVLVEDGLKLAVGHSMNSYLAGGRKVRGSAASTSPTKAPWSQAEG